MQDAVPIEQFLPECNTRVLLDVRSPGEFAKGHIPGALSFPLFSDEERAEVGTCYKQTGPEAALQLGLQYVGPKMAGFVAQAGALAAHRRIAVHCWRGGNRSQSMAWLLRMAGFDVITLQGGYKSYRNFVLGFFPRPQFQLKVLGGPTGSGKTKILHALQRLGEQILDLEALAHHKGSAFGSIGEAPQPTPEQFENDLQHDLEQLDPTRVVWIENESRSIGRVYVPDSICAQMKISPLLHIQIPEDARIQNLLQDYTHSDQNALRESFLKIDTKLGGLNLKTALEALDAGDYATAARIALWYYDKTYHYGLQQHPPALVAVYSFDHGDPDRIAQTLIETPAKASDIHTLQTIPAT
jgi:tRNA 2-selenouridine synthase